MRYYINNKPNHTLSLFLQEILITGIPCETATALPHIVAKVKGKF